MLSRFYSLRIACWFFAVVLNVFISACADSSAEIRTSIANQEQSISLLGVNLVRLSHIDQVPPDGSQSKERGRLGMLNDRQYLEALNTLTLELRKYPPKILAGQLDHIYIGGQIESERERYTAGFFQPGSKDVYLFPNVFAALNHPEGVNLAATLHHEISSLFMRAYQFDMLGFMALLPANIEYWHDESRILENPPNSYNADEELLSSGLLTYYSQTSPENDFNTYAEKMFASPKEMSNFCNSHPLIKLKSRYVQRFYLTVSPYFKGWFIDLNC